MLNAPEPACLVIAAEVAQRADPDPVDSAGARSS
jgi:hypothetical protein